MYIKEKNSINKGKKGICVYRSPSQLNVERRLFTFRFGDPQARMNWVHVDNLVTAHVLAAKALTAGRNHVSVSRLSSLAANQEMIGCSAVWPLFTSHSRAFIIYMETVRPVSPVSLFSPRAGRSISSTTGSR